MLSATPFTTLKPIIPRRVQIALRRMLINWKLSACKDTWPINPAAAAPPEGWQGWPEGKKFALVLTHDVDTQQGHDSAHILAEIEERMGFRSSFNFVAEDLKISNSLINHLKVKGFEIGVHSVRHQNPFKSKKHFQELAVKINHYLNAWDAVGFRSPSMYHNLDMVHDLNIDYDASTFDTDPFEPQSDGVGTIFPFWVPGRDGRPGYVELPYTLPQDFLLYILMQHQNIDLWKQKLNWIVENGGMALFISHPDYMDFSNTKHYEKYPTRYYEEFLTYIKTKYEGQYWHALPRDVAKFWALNYKTTQTIHRKPRHICMLAYSFYESDNRIMRYADALAQRGDSVDVIALKHENAPRFERLKHVNVYRIQKRIIDEKAKAAYLCKLMMFLLRSAIFLTRKQFKHRYDLIHVHSVPDFEVFATLIPKLQGAKVILDIHDIVPEFYASKFAGGKGSFFFKALVKVEQFSIKFSNHVIISNHLWHKTLTGRSVDETKCTTVLNYPDEAIFYKRPRTRNDEKFIMIYPGTLGWHQGLDIAVEAFAKVKNQIPKAEFHIYGRGTESGNLEKLIKSLDLTGSVFLKDPMTIDQIAGIMANADLGIIPKRNDPFGGDAFSTKTLEFMSLGIPIIVSGTRIDKYYFNDKVVRFFTPEDIDDLGRAMVEMTTNENLRNTIRINADRFIEEYHWSKRKSEYFMLVDSLIDNKH